MKRILETVLSITPVAALMAATAVTGCSSSDSFTHLPAVPGSNGVQAAADAGLGGGSAGANGSSTGAGGQGAAAPTGPSSDPSVIVGSTLGGSGIPVPTYNVCSGQGANGGGGGQPGMTIQHAPGLALKIYEVESVGGSLALNPVTIPAGAYDASAEQVQAINGNLVGGSLNVPLAGLVPGKYYTVIVCSAGGLGADDPGCALSVDAAPDPAFAFDFPFSLPISDWANYSGPGGVADPFYYTAIDRGSAVLAPYLFETPGQSLVVFTFGNDGTYTLSAPNFSYLAGTVSGLSALYGGGAYDSDAACQNSASPLLVDTGNSSLEREIALSSPQDGVDFDITGDGTKVRISWPLDPSRDLFLALPAADGSIASVQQLFGNNTVGPDGRRAANGFAALAKYARAGQTRIDVTDPIFSQLRLWADANRNGTVDPGELFTLPEKGIQAIDLSYIGYVMIDAYGNQTRERSWAQGTEDSRHLVFDVWFQLP